MKVYVGIIFDHQLVNSLYPSRTIYIEAPGAVSILTSLFPEFGKFYSSPSIIAVPPNQLMAEHELELCMAVCNRFLEPIVLV